ncbi:hypothetical protein AB0F91_33830 [Amycolatopsis sp. NPDC023774]|uniref:hypothetical protein n=1 Tax=Amycolatopsis sp. NPDC023774 TaxID=3155015 RepID=UPI0033EE1912
MDVLPDLTVEEHPGVYAIGDAANIPARHHETLPQLGSVVEVGKHRHQVDGPVAFAAWLGVHAMLLSGAHSKVDAFVSWAWDYFERDHAATVERSTKPQRSAWETTPRTSRTSLSGEATPRRQPAVPDEDGRRGIAPRRRPATGAARLSLVSVRSRGCASRRTRP